MKEVVVTRIKGTIQIPDPNARIHGRNSFESEVDVEITVPSEVLKALILLGAARFGFSEDVTLRMTTLIGAIQRDSTTR